VDVVLLGVRGSRCAPGADFAGVGGHTSSVLITSRQPGSHPLLLDAGTGLAAVEVGETTFDGEVLLTHLHWDHVQGIPFFAAGDAEGARVRVRMPAQGAARPGRQAAAVALLAESMGPPHFPIGPDQLRGDWTFEAIETGTFDTGPFRVTAVEVPHKGGRTFGYRISENGVTLAYLPDFCPSRSPASCAALVSGADVLLVGGMFQNSEQATAGQFGHATVDEALDLATQAQVGEAIIVHHAPNRTDVEVERMVGQLRAVPTRVRIGTEGLNLSIPSS
jgi:ribonuclease BN (tRNA processing enzyme)